MTDEERQVCERMRYALHLALEATYEGDLGLKFSFREVWKLRAQEIARTIEIANETLLQVEVVNPGETGKRSGIQNASEQPIRVYLKPTDTFPVT